MAKNQFHLVLVQDLQKIQRELSLRKDHVPSYSLISRLARKFPEVTIFHKGEDFMQAMGMFPIHVLLLGQTP